MSYGAAAFLGIAIYLLFLLADVACVALCYFRGRRIRWLCPLVFGINTIPIAFFGFAFCSALADPSRPNLAWSLTLCAVMAIPFLACFVASAVLFFVHRKPAAPKDDSGNSATTMQKSAQLSS
jgi:hypothetical protein